jgi:hypothetical protein
VDSYNSDDKANVTITRNTTLSGLSNGSHSLIVYANDTAGNVGKADFVFFEGDFTVLHTFSNFNAFNPRISLGHCRKNHISAIGISSLSF